VISYKNLLRYKLTKRSVQEVKLKKLKDMGQILISTMYRGVTFLQDGIRRNRDR
jgi:hypothetical protein